MNNIDKIIAALTREKENNEKNLNASEYNDFYLGYREALKFALDCAEAAKNTNTNINFDDIRSLLDREG